MKRKKYIFAIIAFFAMLPGLSAQTAHVPGIKIGNPSAAKQNDQVVVAFDILLDGLKINSNDLVVLTPVLKSNENRLDSIALPPLVVTGKLRNKVLNRRTLLGEPLPFDGEPAGLVVRKNNTAQQMHYNITVPYRRWMRDASLSVLRETAGCADCRSFDGDEPVVANIFPPAYIPNYRLTYIVPEAEVKTRSDRHSTSFNYVVDRYELLRDFKNNAAKLDEVDRIIGEIRDNPDFNITELSIEGYASPEGSFPHNRLLAQNRANSFADYLVSKFGVARNRFTVAGHGEDWTGLREAVAASSLADKATILDIIDNVSNPDARDAGLKKLSGGETYRTLLNVYYPPLRRTEYVVAYTVRAFDVDEARTIIRSNPRLLSLNEMYLVAQSYPADSKEFKEVFDIAVRLYPDSDIAILNSAAADIEIGNMEGAIERMLKIGDNPKVWNNLGVAYARKGDLAKAADYLDRAAATGDGDAAHNRGELEKVKENVE